MSNPYAPVPIAIPDDHPILGGKTLAAWPGFNNPLIATDFATGKMHAVWLGEDGQICKVEECPA